MFNISVERTIKKPIEQVFELISDHANYSQFKGVDKSSLVKEGSENKNGLGAIREIVAATGTLHEEIVRFEPPRDNQANGTKTALIGYKIVFSKPLPYDHRLGEVHLTQSDDKTHVRWISKGTITTFLLGPLYFDKQIQKNGARAFGSILKYIDRL
ncbi:MAG: hypothetical protein ACJA0G_001928 [Kangiellaceae bacterium]|jgi:uncharacterized protein YndB with AHSA1/START domain